MGIVVGIDIGGSTTKIAGFNGEEMLLPYRLLPATPLHLYLVHLASFYTIMI